MRSFVLLLSTDDLLVQQISSTLSTLQIIHCRTVDEAISCCAEHSVSLVIITDTLADGYSGEILEDLQAHFPGVAGVLLTANEDRKKICTLLEAGYSGVVDLPLLPEQLERVINKALERYRLLAENTRLRTLIPLYSLGEQFFSASDEQQILEDLLDAVAQQTGAKRLSVMLYTEQEDVLYVAAARGMDPALRDAIRLKPGDQIAGWVFAKGKPVLLNKESQEQSIFSPLLKQPDIVSAISFPLRLRNRILGVLNISLRQGDLRFSEADTELLGIICSQAAVALENVRARQQLTSTTRMRTLFEQYVAPEVAELLLAQKSDLMGVGSIQETTILFADIRNFTKLVQRIDLSALRSFLNAFFQAFTEEVFQHRGTVDKFMGDAVLSFFGAPVSLEAPSLAAMQAAWNIRRRFQELHQRWFQACPEFKEVDLGIAVTRGTVFLGNLGSARRLDYTVIGNEVNIAQRLAAESSSCRIYMTEPVKRQVEHAFSTVELGSYHLRGIAHTVEVHAVQDQLPVDEKLL